MNASGQGWLRKALRAVGAGVPMTLASDELFCIRPGASIPSLVAYGPMGSEGADEKRKPYRMLDGGIAEIRVTGVLSEHPTLYRMLGCSDQPTLGELRQAVLQAGADADAERVMIYFKTPGGTHAGTPQFAEAVAEVAALKPVHAYAENICCSAGYWPAAQAQRVTAHRAAEVGGIGVFSVLLDASKAAAAEGLKFHVISTGPFKGAGAEPGAGLTPEQLEYFQGRANDAGDMFFGDVAEGRGLTIARVRELGDGRCHIAARAVSLGLIDGVGTYADALEALAAEPASVPSRRAAPPPPDDSENEDDPGELPEEEAIMSDPKKTEPAATAPAASEEDIGLLAKLKALFAVAPAAPAASATPPAIQPAALTAADIDARVEARFQAAEVDRDLQALAGKVPPAVLGNAEIKAALLEAKAKGPDRYKAVHALVAGNDASGLLGGWLATAEQTADAPAGLAVNSRELAALKALGLTAEEVGAVETKYDLRKVN
jgi:signal peptide peptidase SppA